MELSANWMLTAKPKATKCTKILHQHAWKIWRTSYLSTSNQRSHAQPESPHRNQCSSETKNLFLLPRYEEDVLRSTTSTSPGLRTTSALSRSAHRPKWESAPKRKWRKSKLTGLAQNALLAKWAGAGQRIPDHDPLIMICTKPSITGGNGLRVSSSSLRPQ